MANYVKKTIEEEKKAITKGLSFLIDNKMKKILLIIYSISYFVLIILQKIEVAEGPGTYIIALFMYFPIIIGLLGIVYIYKGDFPKIGYSNKRESILIVIVFLFIVSAIIIALVIGYLFELVFYSLLIPTLVGVFVSFIWMFFESVLLMTITAPVIEKLTSVSHQKLKEKISTSSVLTFLIFGSMIVSLVLYSYLGTLVAEEGLQIFEISLIFWGVGLLSITALMYYFQYKTPKNEQEYYIFEHLPMIFIASSIIIAYMCIKAFISNQIVPSIPTFSVGTEETNILSEINWIAPLFTVVLALVYISRSVGKDIDVNNKTQKKRFFFLPPWPLFPYAKILLLWSLSLFSLFLQPTEGGEITLDANYAAMFAVIFSPIGFYFLLREIKTRYRPDTEIKLSKIKEPPSIVYKEIREYPSVSQPIERLSPSLPIQKTAVYCPYCKASNVHNATYCIKCGQKLATNICRYCTTVNVPKAQFCIKCGKGLN